jgi:hypothetical protein
MSSDLRLFTGPIRHILPVSPGVALSAYSQPRGKGEGGRPPRRGVSRLSRRYPVNLGDPGTGAAAGGAPGSFCGAVGGAFFGVGRA